MPHPIRVRRTAAALATTGALLAGLAACTSSGSAGAPTDSTSSGSVTTSTRVVEVSVTSAKGCPAAQSSYPAGALTFHVKNADANAVSEVELLSGERIVGEQENMPPGFSGTFAVNIPAGKYELYCPGGSPERSAISVTGKSDTTSDSTVAALLKAGSAGYAKYVSTQVGALVTATGEFETTLHGTNLRAAQAAYMKARPFYEKIEPVAESFLGLDAAIDERIGGDVTLANWTGFHRIEYSLFKQKSLKGTAAMGAKLVSAVADLQSKTKNLTYKPFELANGAQDLLNEVVTSKITGEEEAYSQIDLLDFANNDEGAEQAFAQLQPALNQIDPVLTRTIARRFTALDNVVNTYRTTANASGFVLYTSLTAADKRKLAAAVKSVQEPLATAAGKVATA